MDGACRSRGCLVPPHRYSREVVLWPGSGRYAGFEMGWSMLSVKDGAN